MSIDKQKLQKLLWAEAASFRADCADWKRNTEALQEFLGEKTVEEVALELLAENNRLGQIEYAFSEWIEKTDWVQSTVQASELGRHRADVLRTRIDQFKAENEALREANDKFSRRNGMLEQNVQVMTETHVLYTWLRKKCDQPSNDFVAVQMNIGHDWVPVHDLDRDLRTMIDREEP
ncbi:hypothetical protein [Pseudomonas sp. Sample_21]|uniref:hypothetical protein n=1 Tax=Pseudomonas sp. Sample_21 TaxID=2448265 RepID=UPI00102F8D64|nr:hypothetical protein [Pseudomonas sp. Sample_21]